MLWLIGFAFILILIVALNQSPIKKTYTIETNKVESNLKAALVADFHSGKAQPIAKWINQEQCDFVLIAGDLFDERRSLFHVRDFLQALDSSIPIYFVSGNHEYKNKEKDYGLLKKVLMDENVIILDNSACLLPSNIQLIGIEDCRHFKKGNEWGQEKEVIQAIMKKVEANTFNLVMLHRPDHYVQFDEYPIDLMVSGHAHGGQWRIPYLLNGIYAPQQGFFPKRAGGQYSLPHGIQIVSRGLSYFPMLPRIFNRPELVLINIIKKPS